MYFHLIAGGLATLSSVPLAVHGYPAAITRRGSFPNGFSSTTTNYTSTTTPATSTSFTTTSINMPFSKPNASADLTCYQGQIISAENFTLALEYACQQFGVQALAPGSRPWQTITTFTPVQKKSHDGSGIDPFAIADAFIPRGSSNEPSDDSSESSGGFSQGGYSSQDDSSSGEYPPESSSSSGYSPEDSSSSSGGFSQGDYSPSDSESSSPDGSSESPSSDNHSSNASTNSPLPTSTSHSGSSSSPPSGTSPSSSSSPSSSPITLTFAAQDPNKGKPAKIDVYVKNVGGDDKQGAIPLTPQTCTLVAKAIVDYCKDKNGNTGGGLVTSGGFQMYADGGIP